MLVLAKNPLIRRSRATLPTKSSTTAVMAGWPPSRSYSVFFGAIPIWACAAVVHNTAATAVAITIRMLFPFLVRSKDRRRRHARRCWRATCLAMKVRSAGIRVSTDDATLVGGLIPRRQGTRICARGKGNVAENTGRGFAPRQRIDRSADSGPVCARGGRIGPPHVVTAEERGGATAGALGDGVRGAHRLSRSALRRGDQARRRQRPDRRLNDVLRRCNAQDDRRL